MLFIGRYLDFPQKNLTISCRKVAIVEVPDTRSGDKCHRAGGLQSLLAAHRFGLLGYRLIRLGTT